MGLSAAIVLSNQKVLDRRQQSPVNLNHGLKNAGLLKEPNSRDNFSGRMAPPITGGGHYQLIETSEITSLWLMRVCSMTVTREKL